MDRKAVFKTMTKDELIDFIMAYDTYIVGYAEDHGACQAVKIVNKGADDYHAKESAFERLLKKEWDEVLNRRRDLAASKKARMGRKRVPSSF